MTLPLFDGSNYTLTPESPETARVFEERSDGSVMAGWEMLVPPPGPDGAPYQYIFVGPTAEHRGTAIRLNVVTRDGAALSGGARVTLETYYKSGEERTVIYEGEYARFLEVPDQQDPRAALSAQRRAEAGGGLRDPAAGDGAGGRPRPGCGSERVLVRGGVREALVERDRVTVVDLGEARS